VLLHLYHVNLIALMMMMMMMMMMTAPLPRRHWCTALCFVISQVCSDCRACRLRFVTDIDNAKIKPFRFNQRHVHEPTVLSSLNIFGDLWRESS